MKVTLDSNELVEGFHIFCEFFKYNHLFVIFRKDRVTFEQQTGF